MGLLQNLAAIAIRNKVISGLRANCPADIKNDLETLLANKEAIDVIQNFVTAAMKSGDPIPPEAIANLPFPPDIRQLLQLTPQLLTYLTTSARMVGKQ